MMKWCRERRLEPGDAIVFAKADGGVVRVRLERPVVATGLRPRDFPLVGAHARGETPAPGRGER